jgi:H/ACA ribonucleoprotein complex subunit 4
MIKKGDLDKYGAKIPGTTPKEWSEGYVDYKEDGVVTFGTNAAGTIATQPQASASTSIPVTATVTEVVKDDEEDKKEKKRKRKSEAAGDGDKTVDGEKKKVCPSSLSSSVDARETMLTNYHAARPYRRRRRPRLRTSQWP